MHAENRREPTHIASYVEPRAFAPNVRSALAGLGYTLVPAFSMGRFDDPSWHPALRIVDERQLDRIPDAEQDPDTPVVVLTGARPRDAEDPRIVGRVPRPCELGSLFPILQRTFEPTPRDSARVPTALSARCFRRDHRWVGSVVSLSTGGCLLRSSEPCEPGDAINLEFALPGGTSVVTRAVTVHDHGGELGLAFVEPPSDVRERIDDFVTRRLASL